MREDQNGSAPPRSVTILRTALFGEARSERFIDYGGFADHDEGWRQHRGYMWRLVNAIRALLPATGKEGEHEFAIGWLLANEPRPDATGRDPIEAEDLTAAVSLAANFLEVDRRNGTSIMEATMRDRLARALGHLTDASIRTERKLSVPQFRGVGPVDVVAGSSENGAVIAAIECKWSTDPRRDKIYEGAWDAVKLALTAVNAPAAAGYLVTGADTESWTRSETADLFVTGTINTRELWNRPLSPRGPNGGFSVGADCEAGGRGNMFTEAPERLAITAVAEHAIKGVNMTIKASRVLGAGPMIAFGPQPEFPERMSQRWLEQNVPAMPDEIYERLIAWLKQKSWTEEELAQRVHPLRDE